MTKNFIISFHIFYYIYLYLIYFKINIYNKKKLIKLKIDKFYFTILQYKYNLQYIMGSSQSDQSTEYIFTKKNIINIYSVVFDNNMYIMVPSCYSEIIIKKKIKYVILKGHTGLGIPYSALNLIF